MGKGITAPIATKPVSAVVASTKRDMVEELENIPTLALKKPRIQDQPSFRVACAGYIYGQYVQESVRLNNPPLDFVTFEARLLGDVEFHCAGQNLEQYMPEIRAIEEKLKNAASTFSTTEKINKLKLAMDVIKTTLPDIERTSPDQAKQLTTIVDGLFLSTLTSFDYCRPMFKEHTSAMKKDLATTETLQDSLGLDDQQKNSMQQVIDSLEARLERSGKLEGLFQE